MDRDPTSADALERPAVPENPRGMVYIIAMIGRWRAAYIRNVRHGMRQDEAPIVAEGCVWHRGTTF